uniref:MGT-16 n=1 Tax=Mus musculus TaxID=10090 RepID=D2XZ15_MOUSE|nr:MGT-16 [Mus musculus]
MASVNRHSLRLLNDPFLLLAVRHRMKGISKDDIWAVNTTGDKAKAPNIAAATACSGGSTGSSQTEVSPSLPRPGSYGDLETGPQELPDEILLG